MRLIDADEALNLIDGETKVETNSNVKAFNDALEVARQIIDTQKTVKAIPIDKPFLKMRYGDYVLYNKKWLVDHLQTEWNILQGKEYQPSIPIEWIEQFMNRFRVGMVTSDEYALLHFMLMEWEREYETNRH